MKSLAATFVAEWMKTRKSKVLWITIILFAFIPTMMGLMIFVVRNPEMAAKLGMIGTKASMFGQNDWPGFLGVLVQTIASLGLIGFGFVTSWVFGREYSERTIKDILALPVSRASIVISKFIIIALWCSLLALIMFTTTILIGKYADLPGWSEQVFYHYVHKFFVTAFLTLLLSTPVAFIASYSRGLMAPIGFVILSMIIAQFTGMVGFGPYFPWSIPGVYTVPSGTAGLELVLGSYFILALTSIAGFAGTIAWWRFADQH